MPNLQGRDRYEAELTAAIYALLADEGSRLSANPKSADWPSFQSRLGSAMETHLQAVYIQAAETLAAEHGLSLNPQVLPSIALQWARQHSAQVAAGIAENSRDAIHEAILARPDEAAELLDKAIAGAFSKSRASGIAITETTRANSFGERYANRVSASALGAMLIGTWHIEDENACERCKELDGLETEEDAPLHPSCRCWKSFSLVGAAALAGAE